MSAVAQSIFKIFVDIWFCALAHPWISR